VPSMLLDGAVCTAVLATALTPHHGVTQEWKLTWSDILSTWRACLVALRRVGLLVAP
jgi:hypothetical protein